MPPGSGPPRRRWKATGLPSKPRRKRREGFSDKLPRIRIELTLSEEEKASAAKAFFTKVKEELDIVPAQARVLEYWQEKAVFEDDGGESTIKVESDDLARHEGLAARRTLKAKGESEGGP